MPRGDGHPVYLLPGFMADGESMAMLGRWLGGLGYNAIPWGLGRNVGPRGILMTRLIATVRGLAREHRQPVSLIGHSLGGVFAREIAKVIPKQIRQVITLGSPFRQTDANGAAGVLRLVEMAAGKKADDLQRKINDLSRPAPVPSTAIYSRSDGIANWKACIEEEAPYTDNIEVYASHSGMSSNPTVYYAIGDRLAQPAGKWRKFARSGAGRFAYYPAAIYAARTPMTSSTTADATRKPRARAHSPSVLGGQSHGAGPNSSRCSDHAHLGAHEPFKEGL